MPPFDFSFGIFKIKVRRGNTCNPKVSLNKPSRKMNLVWTKSLESCFLIQIQIIIRDGAVVHSSQHDAWQIRFVPHVGETLIAEALHQTGVFRRGIARPVQCVQEQVLVSAVKQVVLCLAKQLNFSDIPLGRFT